jgi:AcrR family transcriptional regulator
MARPPDPDVSRRILQAAVDLLGEGGYAALTLEGVAARAGVGRPAVYRRYSGKRELCLAAIESLLPPPVVTIDGPPKERLKALFRGLASSRLPRYVGLVGELIGLEPLEPQLAETWRRSVLDPRRAVALDLLHDIAAEGVLRPGLDLDFAMNALTGQLLARVWEGRPLDEEWFERTWQQLWASFTATGPT